MRNIVLLGGEEFVFPSAAPEKVGILPWQRDFREFGATERFELIERALRMVKIGACLSKLVSRCGVRFVERGRICPADGATTRETVLGDDGLRRRRALTWSCFALRA
jgi:hypothetical protein